MTAARRDGEPLQPPACHEGDFQPFTGNLRIEPIIEESRTVETPVPRKEGVSALVTRFHRTRRFLKPTSHRDESCADRESETGGEPCRADCWFFVAPEEKFIESNWNRSAHRTSGSAMPRRPSPDLTEISVLGEDNDDDQEPIGAVASIHAAAKKGTRPVVKLPNPGKSRSTTWGERQRVAPARCLSNRALGRPLTRVSFRLVSSTNSLPFANRSRVVRRRLRRDGRRTRGPHPRAHRQDQSGSTPADGAENQQG